MPHPAISAHADYVTQDQFEQTIGQLQKVIKSLVEAIKAANLPATGCLRLPQVLSLIPVSKAKWYAGVASGDYPKPINIGTRAVAWRVEDILELRAKLAAGEWAPAKAGKDLKKSLI